MKSTAAKAWILILAVALAAYGGYRLRLAYRSPEEPRPSMKIELGFPVGEFQLTTSSGEPFNSKDLEGELWVISFFFTECPSFCPKLNHSIAAMLEKDLADVPVRVVSITVDPKKDTPEELARYAQVYKEQYHIPEGKWLFLTDAEGRRETIVEVSKQLKIAFGKLTHSDRMIVIDRRGLVQGYYHGEQDADMARLKAKIRELAAARGDAAKEHAAAQAAGAGA